uniref:Uncharacterized protein n=1 Tax=Sphaerodactylus townsendi TaxID=933632 RepID=A0ACB8EZS0_9SAUR
MMKGWGLFWLGLALLCSVHAEPECTGDDSQMEGTWHVIGAGSNGFHISIVKDVTKMVTASMSFPEEGKLKVTSNFPLQNGCKIIEMEFEKMDDGMYYHFSEVGKKTIEIVRTDCEDYAIVIVKIEKDGKASTILILFSKNREVSPEIKQHFTAVGERQGLMSDQIVFFSPEGVLG